MAAEAQRFRLRRRVLTDKELTRMMMQASFTPSRADDSSPLCVSRCQENTPTAAVELCSPPPPRHFRFEEEREPAAAVAEAPVAVACTQPTRARRASCGEDTTAPTTTASLVDVEDEFRRMEVELMRLSEKPKNRGRLTLAMYASASSLYNVCMSVSVSV
jgi:hypothetical protein